MKEFNVSGLAESFGPLDAPHMPELCSHEHVKYDIIYTAGTFVSEAILI